MATTNTSARPKRELKTKTPVDRKPQRKKVSLKRKERLPAINAETIAKKPKKPCRCADGSFEVVRNPPGTYIWVNGKAHLFAGAIKLRGQVANIDGSEPCIRATVVDLHDQNQQVEVPCDSIGSRQALLAALNKAGAGLTYSPNEKRSHVLQTYFQTQVPANTTIRPPNDGWLELPDKSVAYALNKTLYGSNAGKYKLAKSTPSNSDNKEKISSWHELVVTLANDLTAVLAMLVALASVLLEPLKLPPIIFVLIGRSSTGKSTILKICNSLFDKPSGIATWEATANGLEAAVIEHRHKPFVIDEVGQGDAKLFDSAAYRLTNSSTKLRADQKGRLVKSVQAQSNVISAGEISPMDVIKKAGGNIAGGQRARILPIHIAESFGVWTNLGDFKSGAEKTMYVMRELENCYGVAAPLYCKYAAEHIDSMRTDFDQFSNAYRPLLLAKVKDNDLDAVAARVLETFLLFAFAGELAIAAGSLKWKKNHILGAVSHGFSVWLSEHNRSAPATDEAIMSRFSLFFQSQRRDMFKPISEFDESHTGIVAGYEHTIKGVPVFLVLPAFFEKVLCKDLEKKEVIKVLSERGLLILNPRKSAMKQVHVPGKKGLNPSFYVVNRDILLS